MKTTVQKQLSNRLPAGVFRFSDVLPQLMARYGVQQQRDIEALDRAWKSAVQEPYSAITRAVGLKRGTLEVCVPHNAFIQELSFQLDDLTAKVRENLPNEKIKKIKFVIRER